eukprot:SAG22_NODE_12444_length_442_cov_1.857143_2_plen_58_part_01
MNPPVFVKTSYGSTLVLSFQKYKLADVPKGAAAAEAAAAFRRASVPVTDWQPHSQRRL